MAGIKMGQKQKIIGTLFSQMAKFDCPYGVSKDKVHNTSTQYSLSYTTHNAWFITKIDLK